jgi:hypothetical protein
MIFEFISRSTAHKLDIGVFITEYQDHGYVQDIDAFPYISLVFSMIFVALVHQIEDQSSQAYIKD